MSRMTKRNLHNIKCIFEEKTGADLNPAHRTGRRFPYRKALVLAAVLALGALLVGFTYPLFTPLDGDELSLTGTYEGNGVVSVYVENGSDKDLKFEEKVKLISWVNSEEAAKLEGDVIFENTAFPAHSSGVMTIDLSAAYDMDALENAQFNQEWYYLLLTNNSFLFGYDWMCSVCFGEAEAQEQTVPETEEKTEAVPVEPEIMEMIDENLRFYFEDAYGDEIPAFNGENFNYLQKVRELIQRFEGRVVSSVDTALILDRLLENVILDETYPDEIQYRLIGQHTKVIDGYGRVIGSSESENALVVNVLLRSRKQDRGSGIYMPLVYFLTYPAAEIQSEEDFAFIYGQFHTFGELEKYKVYEDEQYAVYEVTDLMYTDLDAYIDYFRNNAGAPVYYDEDIRDLIWNAYTYYKNRDNLRELFHYHLPGLCEDIPAE